MPNKLEIAVNTDQIVFLKRRSFGNVITDALRFVKHNFWPLLQAIMLSAGILAAISSLILGVAYSDNFGPAAMQAMGVWGGSSIWNSAWFRLIGIVTFFFTFALQNAVVSHYLVLYNQYGPGNFTPGMAAKKAWKSLFSYSFAQFCCYVIILVAAMFCLVPSLFAITMLSAVWIIMANEGKGAFSAIERSWQLVRQDWGTVLGLVIVVYMLTGYMQGIIQLPFAILNAIISTFSLRDDYENGFGATNTQAGFTLISILNILVYFIAQLWFYIVSSIYNIALSLKYFDLLERKEAIILLKEIDSIGKPVAKTDDNNLY